MITIYGASDDVIVVEGAINEEFPYQKRGYGQPSGDLLAFSDGTILRIALDDDGIWRIAPLFLGSGSPTITQAPVSDGAHSDRATVEAVWVVQGMAWASVMPGREF